MKINNRVRYKINRPPFWLDGISADNVLGWKIVHKNCTFSLEALLLGQILDIISWYISLPSLKRNVKPGQLPRYNPGISVAKKYSLWKRASSIILHRRKQILCVESSKILETWSQLRSEPIYQPPEGVYSVISCISKQARAVRKIFERLQLYEIGC